MKKLLGLILIVGLYLAAAFYTGYQGEKNIRHQFAMAEQKSEAQGVKLVLNNYERGILFSEMDFSASYGEAAAPVGALTLNSKSRIQHGPLLFANGFGVGLFSAESTLELTTSNEAVNQDIKAVFGESIGELVTVGHFNNTYSGTWTLADIVYENDGSTLTLAESIVKVEGSYDDVDVAGSFTIGAIEFLAADGSKVNVAPVSANFATDNIAESVTLSNLDMMVEKIDFSDGAMVAFSIEQLKMVQQQKLVNEKIDTSISFTAAKVQSPVEITSLRYDFALNQVDPAAVQKWTEIATKMQSSPADPQELFTQYSDDTAELMDLLLQEGLVFTLGLGADFMGGAARLDLSAHYQPLPDGQQFKDIVNPLDYFLMVDSDLLIKISESIVTQTPLVMMVGQYVGTYITQEGDQYVLHATLNDGKLMVGNTEVPLEMLLAFLPAAGATEAAVDDPLAEQIVQ